MIYIATEDFEKLRESNNTMENSKVKLRKENGKFKR